MSLILSALFALSLHANANEINRCEPYSKNLKIIGLLESLATKLSYQYEELCTLTRLMSIHHETRLVHHRQDDQYHPYEFVTLHYNEYSCEYQYSWDDQEWRDQQCYNTF